MTELDDDSELEDDDSELEDDDKSSSTIVIVADPSEIWAGTASVDDALKVINMVSLFSSRLSSLVESVMLFEDSPAEKLTVWLIDE